MDDCSLQSQISHDVYFSFVSLVPAGLEPSKCSKNMERKIKGREGGRIHALSVRGANVSDFHWRLSGLLPRWFPLSGASGLPMAPAEALYPLINAWHPPSHPWPLNRGPPSAFLSVPTAQPFPSAIQAFTEHCWVPGTLLGIWDTAVNKAKSQSSLSLHASRDSKQKEISK